MTRKRMEKVRLSKAVAQDAIDFNFGGRSVIVGRQPASISTADFQAISSHYPGWIERVEPPVSKTAAAKAATNAV